MLPILAGIIQLSDSLVRGGCGKLSAKAGHFAGTIHKSSNHLLNIINDILDVAALKEGKLAIKHECVEVTQASTAFRVLGLGTSWPGCCTLDLSHDVCAVLVLWIKGSPVLFLAVL